MRWLRSLWDRFNSYVSTNPVSLPVRSHQEFRRLGAMAKATQANSSNRVLVSVMGRNRSSAHSTRRATVRVYKALQQADLILVLPQ